MKLEHELNPPSLRSILPLHDARIVSFSPVLHTAAVAAVRTAVPHTASAARLLLPAVVGFLSSAAVALRVFS